MTFSQIADGTAVFIDANTLVYHFTSEPQFGASCTQLVKRTERHEIYGYSSTHVLADVAHRLMTLEAVGLFGWPLAGIAARLRKHSDQIAKLSIYRQAIASIPNFAIQIVPVTQSLIEAATDLISQHKLLTGDALIAAVMYANGLHHLASNDADFDHVPRIVRYGPA